MNYTYNITHKKHINMKTQTGGKSKHPIYETMVKINVNDVFLYFLFLNF